MKRHAGLRAVLAAMSTLVLAGAPAGESGPVAGPVAIDFSHAGYGGGGVAAPAVPAVLRVRPTGGDDTAMLQAALDRVAAHPLRDGGFRGALALAPGMYRVGGQLRMDAGGVVLRGIAADDGALPVIRATGNDRRTLICLGQKSSASAAVERKGNGDNASCVADETVPAGACEFTLESSAFESPGGIGAGARVIVTRPSTKAWIDALGMAADDGAFAALRTHWLPGSRDLIWDRTVVAVDRARNRITLDAPLTTALEQRYGGGTVAVRDGALTARVGVENLILESEFDPANPRDEEHAWIAVAVDNIEDAWVRGVTARHFAGSAVRVGARARRVLVADCRSERPVSEIGGYRRESFFVEGQQVLVVGCTAESGWRDFATGACAAGPNVFLDCRAENALGPSGAAESWTSGVLCERVRVAGPGAGLLLTLDNTRAQGGGWTAANSVVWNCEAPRIEVRGPAGAENRVVRSAGPLYERQLAARGLSLPPRAATVCAGDDAAPLFEWASHAGVSAKPVACEARGMPPLEIVNGRFVIGGRAVWGGAVNAAWWRGQYTATNVPDSGVSITRFVPGRDGRGLTEVLEDTAARMAADGTPFYQAGPGLWYDRRRDDHRTVARPDANVWTPFYEMPWARSGCGVAWDGLSKYDLAKYNPWYFSRTKTFAALCRAYGLVLHNNFYNTHNFLETLAHWVDCPLRPANNINDTGLPEPPPVDAGNTIHVATSVYSVADPRLRALHRAYIRHQLDTFEDETNVIHTLAFQFAGPLAFQEFFLDEVAAWQREKPGRRARVALVTSKDVTDAILARLERARLVDVIDMRYWQTLADGTPWAPHGEGTLAFREQNWLTYKRSGDTPAASASLFVYRQVREYRDRCPGKAIVAWHGGAGAMPVLMAGGAQALMRNPAAGQSQGDIDRTPLDVFVRKHLAADLARLNPRDHWFADPERVWCLADDAGRTLLVSALPSADIIPLSERMQTATWDALWFNPSTGGTQVEQGLVLKTGVPVKTNTHAGAEQTAWMLLLRAK